MQKCFMRLCQDFYAPRRFSTKWMAGLMDGRTDGLIVEFPIKFKFFIICYGSKSLYFLGQTNEPFAHISLCIRAVTRAPVSHLLLFLFFKVGRMVFLLPHGSSILAPVDFIFSHQFDKR